MRHPSRSRVAVGTIVLAACLLQCSRGSESSGGSGSLTTAPGATTQPVGPTRPAGTTQPASTWTPPSPRSAGQRVQERERMVEMQIEAPRDFRTPVRDPRVLAAMRLVPRHVFVPEDGQRGAYADHALPIGLDQTISQPYIVALMTEALGLQPGEKVLEIGTGSGYQAAVLAQLTPHVYTIELLEPLATRARRVLKEEGYTSVHCRCGDGYQGWPEAAPFDAIILTCATPEIPRPLWEQLATGGRIVMPEGPTAGPQKLVIHNKMVDAGRKSATLTYVRFVPLVREQGGE